MTRASDRLLDELRTRLGDSRVHPQAPLAPLTTLRVGGAADILVEVHTSAELADVVRLAHAHEVPVTLLGGGSNVLVSDDGVRGLVIRSHGGAIKQPEEGLVRADAGVTINGLVRWTMSRGLGGLQAWAGTPGTVGGAVWGNAHFGGRLIGERIAAVGVLRRDGTTRRVSSEAMAFGYDASRLQRTGEVALWADFRVMPGCDPVALRLAARQSLAFRKRTQPLHQPSAGCVFRNPEPGRDVLPPGIPASAGALVDRAGLKGLRVGGAQVSETHGNFIVNTGNATAADIRALVQLCREKVAERFGVILQEEIVYVGE